MQIVLIVDESSGEVSVIFSHFNQNLNLSTHALTRIQSKRMGLNSVCFAKVGGRTRRERELIFAFRLLAFFCVTVTVFQGSLHFSTYTLIGWGAPVIMTTAWAIITGLKYSASKYVQTADQEMILARSECAWCGAGCVGNRKCQGPATTHRLKTQSISGSVE